MPSPLDTFTGNGRTVQRLRRAFQRERAGALRCHAYLLTGPPGVGKRTLAGALGAALVCESAEAGAVPCGACRACRLVERQVHPDVRRVEPESGKRGVTIEQVRQLEHDAGLRPYEAPRKALIVVAVDLMTEAAANALLKTLEEPPADTVLLLTAGDVSAVLPTIVSRCREVPLRPVPAPEIERDLQERGVDPAEARRLARLAGGCPGWALRAVQDPERLATHAGRVAQLEALMAQPRRQRLPAAAAFGDAAATLDVLDVWIGWWRDALLVQQALPDLVTNVDRVESLRHLGAGHPPGAVWSAIRRTAEARQQVSANANVRLAMETLLLDLPDPVALPA